jgi:putative ABC transport system permease protein
MIRNFFKTAWRIMIHKKIYSAINILGLAAGMGVALMIGIWVFAQYRFDRALPGFQLAYQAMNRFDRNGEAQSINACPRPLAAALKRDVSQVEYAATCDWMGPHGILVGDKKLYLHGVQTEPDFLKIFRYRFLEGNEATVLREVYSIVLTQSTAASLFGKTDPIGQLVRIDNAHDMKVTGILQDLPANSSFRFDFIIPFAYYEATENWVRQSGTSWDNNSFQVFVSLYPKTSYAQAEPALRQIIRKYSPDQFKTTKAEIFLFPQTDWHLYSEFKGGRSVGGFIDYVRMFTLIGLLVLVIACINFVNLSTARYEKRAREVGVRKAVGSSRRNLIFQFLVESLLVTLFAFGICLLITQLFIRPFSTLTQTEMAIPFGNVYFWLIMAGYVLITTLLAGCRPAFFLSAFRPVQVLKGSLRMGRVASLPRKILVVIQFTCSVALIISTLVVYRQIRYVKQRPTGYDREGLVLSDINNDLDKQFSAFKNDMLGTGMVSSVTKSSSPITEIYAWTVADDWPEKNPGETVSLPLLAVSPDYFKTLGMQILQGRDFTGALGADSLSVILNSAAVKRFRFKEPLNQTIRCEGNKLKVVGVVNDALMLSPFSNPIPSIFIYNPGWSNSVMYRIKPGTDIQSALAKIGQLFNRYSPSYPYTYRFASDNYAQKFHLEVLVSRLAALFSLLAVLISCLGLFGLAAFIAEQKTKEIGIRKVLGSSVGQVWIMLSRDFLVLVLVSCLVASPIAYYFLHHWLLKYDYHIGIGAGVFLLASALAITITLCTISFQAIKAALANPAKSLRTE